VKELLGMGKKRRRIVVVHEEEDEERPIPVPIVPTDGGGLEVASESTKRKNRKTKKNKKRKAEETAGRKSRGAAVTPPHAAGQEAAALAPAQERPRQAQRVEVVQSSCCDCGAYELAREPLNQRWSSELQMYGSVVYKLTPAGTGGHTRADAGRESRLRIDACHFERGGAQLYDAQFRSAGQPGWRAGTLSSASGGPNRWLLTLSGGQTLTLEFGSSVDVLALARFDEDLPYGTDPRLSVPRAGLASSVDDIAPSLPPELRAALGKAQMRGRGSLFFSGIAFARHLALSSLPAASLLPHAAFLLNLDAAPFHAVKRWAPHAVMELLRDHASRAADPDFRPVYGNVQARKLAHKTTGGRRELGANEVYNGELAADCLAKIDPDQLQHDADDDAEQEGEEEAEGQQAQAVAPDRCYLHEVQAQEVRKRAF
jgi:hypothetical protein